MTPHVSNARIIAELRLAAMAFHLGCAGQSKPVHTDTGVTLSVRAKARP